MSIFTQTLPRRNSAQAGSRNPLNLIPLGLVTLIALSIALMAAQEAGSAPSRDLTISTRVTGRYVSATTDLALYRRDSVGRHAHAGVLFGGVTVQVMGVSADGQWWQVPCGDGSNDACWVTAKSGLTMMR